MNTINFGTVTLHNSLHQNFAAPLRYSRNKNRIISNEKGFRKVKHLIGHSCPCTYRDHVRSWHGRRFRVVVCAIYIAARPSGAAIVQLYNYRNREAPSPVYTTISGDAYASQRNVWTAGRHTVKETLSLL